MPKLNVEPRVRDLFQRGSFFTIMITKIIIMNQIILFLTTLLFGKRAHGEMTQAPTFRSTYPEDQPDENQWALNVKFGSRYGHKGSFYQRNNI